jgi:predicted P-loop ATPase
MPERAWDTDPELRDAAEAERAKNRRNGEWRDTLLVSKTGKPLPLLANAVAALRGAPEWDGAIWHDAFKNATTLRGRAPWMTTAPSAAVAWDDRLNALVACWLQSQGIAVGAEVAGRAVATVAHDSVFHPVLDYLTRCRWDAEDTPYCRAVVARWLVAAVARVNQPGCKQIAPSSLRGRKAR